MVRGVSKALLKNLNSENWELTKPSSHSYTEVWMGNKCIVSQWGKWHYLWS